MKPLGLEGKVGAPAIVEANSLLHKYDGWFRPFCESPERYVPLEGERARKIVLGFLPFTWRDVLGVVSERYADDQDDILSWFVSSAATVLPDAVLTYDLDTPRLDLSFKGTGLAHTRRLVDLRGSCGRLLGVDAVDLLVSGRASTVVGSRKGLVMACGDVEVLQLDTDSFGILRPSAGGVSAHTATLRKGSLLLSDAATTYLLQDVYPATSSTSYPLIGPAAYADDIARIVDRAWAFREDPLTLLCARDTIVRELTDARERHSEGLIRRMEHDPFFYDSAGFPFRRFTPRGASR